MPVTPLNTTPTVADAVAHCPICETGKQCQQVETSDPSFVKLRCLTCNTHFKVFFKPIQ